MDWPCTGCRFLTPEDVDFDVPIPLMVTFHGDEGDPQYIHSSFSNATRDANFLLLSLKCPAELGCQDPSYENPGSWYEWRRTDMHDPEWVGRQVDEVEAQYNVELNQVYLAGFSGGSIYTSWYALEFADRFAGVNYLGGGSAPRGGQCTAECEIPAYFLIGSKDFLIDGARGMHDYLEGCMHDVLWDEVPGVDHTIIRENLPDVLQWLGDRPHMCRDDGDESGSDGGDESGSDGGGESGSDGGGESEGGGTDDEGGSDSDDAGESGGDTGGDDGMSEDGADDSDAGSGDGSGTGGGTDGGSAGDDAGSGGSGGDSGGGGADAGADGGMTTTTGPGQQGPWGQHDDTSCRVAHDSPPLAVWLWVVAGLGMRRRRASV